MIILDTGDEEEKAIERQREREKEGEREKVGHGGEGNV